MREFLRVPEQLPAEQKIIRAKCFHPSGSFIEFTKDEVEQSIPDRFEKIARLYPDRLAVKTREQALAYADLNRAANRVARAILEKRGEGYEPIALLLENDAPMIAAILGALKAGKIYVPLDTSYPRASIAYILEDSEAGVIATNNRNLPLARELAHSGRQVVNVDEIDSNSPAPNPNLNISPDSPANILYTSGSTGQPKGVVQNHRNVLHEIMNYTNGVHICADDRLILVSSPSFSGTVRTVYGALLNGAGLYPFDVREEGLARLAEWMIRQGITIYRSVPAIFRHFLGASKKNQNLSDVRVVYLAGDSVSKDDVESYKKYFSQKCILANSMGLSETLTCRWYFLDKDTHVPAGAVPVGYPVPDMDVVLLDDDGKELGFDQAGEIAIKSPYLSSGYWRKPELTAAAFSAGADGASRLYRTGDLGRMSPDGCLEHLGRKDFQVKIRGHRIEVSAIETALLELDTIKEAVVVAGAYAPADPSTALGTDLRLAAYVVPRKQPGPAGSSLRNFLREKLPDYMIPSAFILLDALPLTPNGKVDRRSLPAPDPTRPELGHPFVAPRSSIEEMVAGIWSLVLGLEQVGVHDNFFDLGGHSLLATQVISRVWELYRIEISLRNFFETPTVAGTAEGIQKAKARDAESTPPQISRVPRRMKSPL
jgi:amino acid adenylation domain-containing protein